MKNKLIINADDFGISYEVNEAIALCVNRHYINQTTIMVNMPYVDEAVKLSQDNGFSDLVGLHLNLVEGKPLTEGIRDTFFCDDKGMFISKVMKTPKYRMRLDKKISECVHCEIEAQIKAFLELGIGRKHLDSHQHSHVNPSILRILLPLLAKYDFEDVRLSRNLPPGKINGLKKVLKASVNSQITHYNNAHSKREVLGFGSMQDVNDTKTFNGITEMMVHPIIRKGRLSEAFADVSLDEWWDDNETFFELI